MVKVLASARCRALALHRALVMESAPQAAVASVMDLALAMAQVQPPRARTSAAQTAFPGRAHSFA